MPTYDYQCDDCGHKFDKFQSITARALRKCPSCGKLKLRRLIGPGGGVIFKGSGFYATDYRSKSYREAAKNDKDTPTKPKADSGESTPSKPPESKSSEK